MCSEMQNRAKESRKIDGLPCPVSDKGGWEKIDFKKAAAHVRRLQDRLTTALLNKEFEFAEGLTHLLLHSFYAKALAVENVSTNRGKHTHGVDGIVLDNVDDKYQMIYQLRASGYRANALLRKAIPKANGKVRYLGIPTMKDRAMQTLYSFALEPYAEITGDRHSYGFRRNRCATILRNRKYLGFYIYGDVEIPGGMPQIIPDELFNKVAARMELNKKAPGRNRAKAEYLLTQKMYCGYCGEMMIGHSSNQISTKGVIYNYYRCKNAGGKRPCKKKMMGKDVIEDLVIKECKKLLTESNIQRIAKEVVKLAESDEAFAILKGHETTLRRLQKELQNQILNLRKCDSDFVRNIIVSDIEKISAEIKEAESKIALEKANHIAITEEQVVEHLARMADGDILDNAYRRTLVRIFINKILIYDDKMVITFKTGNEDVEITPELLDKIEGGLGNETLCFSEATVHHEKTPVQSTGVFSCVRESKGRLCVSRVTKCPGDTWLARGRFHRRQGVALGLWTAVDPPSRNANDSLRVISCKLQTPPAQSLVQAVFF